MFKEVIMNATWLASAILVLVGIIKTPFKGFKERKPKLYRATFFILSLILVIAGSIFVDLYIFEEALMSWTFAILLISTGFGVFAGYATYENIGIKAGLHKLVEVFKKWADSDKKVAKYISKVGMDRIITVNDKITAESLKETAETKEEIVIEISENHNENSNDL